MTTRAKPAEDFAKRDGWHTAFVLRRQPQLIYKLDTSKMNKKHWNWLLARQPQLAKYRKTKKKRRKNKTWQHQKTSGN